VLVAHFPTDWTLAIRRTYQTRFLTEPLFGDCKEAGFRLAQSRLHHAARLSRLFLATAAAHPWMATLGSQVIATDSAALKYFQDRLALASPSTQTRPPPPFKLVFSFYPSQVSLTWVG
jgi:hypothetical protein